MKSSNLIALLCVFCVCVSAEQCQSPADSLSTSNAVHEQTQALRTLFASNFGVPSITDIKTALNGVNLHPQLLQSENSPLSNAELFKLLGALWLDQRDVLLAHVERAYREAELVGVMTHFTITVENEKGRKFSFRVAGNDTVASVKARIQEEEPKFPVQKQRLIHFEHSEVEMNDDSVLFDHGVQANSILSLYVPDLLSTIHYQGAVTHAGISKFQWPESIAFDRERNSLLVVDYGKHRVVSLQRPRFGLNWQFGHTDQSGSDQSHLSYPTACAIFHDRVLIADSFNSRIVELTVADGKLVRTIGTKGSATDKLEFSAPMGIAVDAVDSNSVWVADTDNHRVMRFRVNNGDWALVSQLGSTQESGDSNLMFNSPNRVATRGSLLFVLDKFNHRVQVFNSSTSKYLRTIGSGREGTGDGDLNYPNNFHVSDNGMVYISEASQFRISIFKVTGEFVGYFAGARGSTDKNSVMAAISGVFHDQATDTVFASDDRFNGKHGRITVWKLKESPLSEIVAME